MSEIDQLLKTIHDPIEFMCQVGFWALDPSAEFRVPKMCFAIGSHDVILQKY